MAVGPRGLCPLGIGLTSVFAHRIPAHFNAMGVVHEPVEDAVGHRGIAYLFVAAWNRQLRGQIVDRTWSGLHRSPILIIPSLVAALIASSPFAVVAAHSLLQQFQQGLKCSSFAAKHSPELLGSQLGSCCPLRDACRRLSGLTPGSASTGALRRRTGRQTSFQSHRRCATNKRSR